MKHKEFKNGICEPFFQNPLYRFFANSAQIRVIFLEMKVKQFWVHFFDDEWWVSTKMSSKLLSFHFSEIQLPFVLICKKLWYGFWQNGLQILFLNSSCQIGLPVQFSALYLNNNCLEISFRNFWMFMNLLGCV